MTASSLSESLARWAGGVRFEDLPPAVVHHVKRYLLDYLGVAVRGSASPFARKLQAYLSVAEGSGEAAVLGTRHKLSPANAALANGSAATVLELDQGHARVPIHLAAVLMPAILSTAQVRGSSAGDVIAAIAAAYEVSSRLAIAAHRIDRQGLNFTSLIGVMGAATGAARLTGPGTIANALGIAGSNAGGLFDYHGGWLDTWCLNTGRASREGVLCAALAEQGFAGPADILDGPRGLSALFHGERLDRGSVLDGIGRDWAMADTYVKLHPCCRILHPVIDAVLALRATTGATIDEIDEIVVETSRESARLDGKTVDTAPQAQMSIPYGVAAAMVFGPPRLEHFDEDARADPRVRQVLQRVDVRTSEDPDIAERRLTARVSLSIRGAMVGVTVDDPLGNPGNPVGDDLLEDKFRTLVEPVLGEEASQRIIKAVWDLDGQGEPLRAIERLIQR